MRVDLEEEMYRAKRGLEDAINTYVDSVDQAIRTYTDENVKRYEPMAHTEWLVGELIVNVRTGSSCYVSHRKVAGVDDMADALPGWWCVDALGRLTGGVGDFVTDWRSLRCLLAERRFYDL